MATGKYATAVCDFSTRVSRTRAALHPSFNIYKVTLKFTFFTASEFNFLVLALFSNDVQISTKNKSVLVDPTIVNLVNDNKLRIQNLSF